MGWKRVWQLAAASCHGFLPLRPTSKPRSDGLKIELRFLERYSGKNPGSLDRFEHLGYTTQKEYIEWITEAKTETT
ncbi:YdeI/OmpD-associated family protein [Echinicola rosea]|uniref:Uncharacterized protein n=1 Tax=Echinicola rosea TaxID=1807691 RepID=A0ABQ1UY49_9BACT|nr:YdeI/OmpD-associated family protein [Echinicola rosea]GGF27965.1 hypothetical protein GCM10011339_15130 [Echinicola rosea]